MEARGIFVDCVAARYLYHCDSIGHSPRLNQLKLSHVSCVPWFQLWLFVPFYTDVRLSNFQQWRLCVMPLVGLIGLILGEIALVQKEVVGSFFLQTILNHVVESCCEVLEFKVSP